MLEMIHPASINRKMRIRVSQTRVPKQSLGTRINYLFGVAIVGFAAVTGTAAEISIFPTDTKLTGKQATQQLLVVTKIENRTNADLTAKAKFTTSDPKIAVVDEAGVVRPVGDGEAIITATLETQKTTTIVKVTNISKPVVWSFRNHVEPILTRAGCNSGACHGALAGKGGFKLSLRGYDPDTDHDVITRQALARRVDVSHPTDSLLLKKASRKLPHGGGTRFKEDTEHYQVLRQWIAAGAPKPGDNEPSLTSIELFPPAALGKLKDTFRLLVRAKYSDGTTADVTHLAKFLSNEEQVAPVDEDGTVSIAGHGEAGISALFGSRVATMTMTSPYPGTYPSEAFAKARKTNYIDDEVLAKLRLLNLPPSADATEIEFIRRVYLDICGILPTPSEVTDFVTDQTVNKRAKLIDKLLERPEYVDYWSHKWSDLFLVSSRRLSQPAVWAFYRTVRRSVADNQPWDQLAQEIITASGSALANGGGNYYVIHKDAPDLVESSAITFLGTSVACARCHNHPLEKWTQDQYWAMANLFGRVGLKAGAKPNEVVVQSLPDGDVLHPRRGVPVPPAPLDGKPLPLDSTMDRRTYFADWLTTPENPFFARALVNRVWRNFLGRGLVEAEDDIRDTNPPTNRELLAALTKDFVAHKFDVKQLIRTIANSATYQRSSIPLLGNATDDRFYSHYLVRRLTAEVILDAYSDITGVATPFNQLSLGPSGGTAAASYPMGTRAMQLPDSQLISNFLDAFGRADRSQACSCERTSDASVGQALHLNNGKTLNDKLRDPNSRLSKWIAEKKTDASIIDEIFRLGLSRPPSPGELNKFLPIVSEAAKDGTAARREALEDVVWAVLTGKEFLFNH